MIAFIEGRLVEKNPAYVVLDCQGIGYIMFISLYTYSQLPNEGTIKLFTHQVIRDDAHQLFGFSGAEERDLFRHLISVSGIGPNTARLILSSMNPMEVKKAIAGKNVSLLQSIKGIGAKTAHRLVVDLHDRFEKEGIFEDENLVFTNNTIHEEALSALVMLGFAKNSAQKALAAILKKKQGTPVTTEELVKEALKSF